MARYTLGKIAEIVGGTCRAANPESVIDHLLTDSRKILVPRTSLFFALQGPRRDGSQFIPELYQRGVRNFVVSKQPEGNSFPDAGYIVVQNVLKSLQALAVWHRQRFQIPVIGITGSNGKTIVKEWLNQLLEAEFNIVRSPRSFNSQIGVPLSVWQMNEENTLGIFEAGISLPGEMDNLERMIQPTIGVFTYLGEAHQEGFASYREKILEKLKLFHNCHKFVFNKDSVAAHLDLTGTDRPILPTDIELISWGRKAPADLLVVQERKRKDDTWIEANYQGKMLSLSIPFHDQASVDNAMTCYGVLLALGYDHELISARMKTLRSVGMRLELKSGINHCSVINDSYVADLSSLNIALDFLQQQRQHPLHTVILSDLLQSGMESSELYMTVSEALQRRNIGRLIGIGKQITEHQDAFANEIPRCEFYSSTEEFMHHFHSSQFRDEAILVKGARIFEFEMISHLLEQKVHQTVLEINLSHLVHNLKQYQRLIRPATKIMAMVKAFSYGSGSYEIANILQFHKIDYLAVAYADEGVELRKAGIQLPIMVMNPEPNSFDALLEYHLEPEIFSFAVLHAFDQFLKAEAVPEFPVHIKIDSGMHRLGFERQELDKLAKILSAHGSCKVQSVFSHFAASEDPAQDAFTRSQAELFSAAAAQLEQSLGYSFLKHISNSAAIARYPQYQFDMVRLGIGLYGVDTTASSQLDLKEVARLRTTIAQIKDLKAGESVGYSRKGQLGRDSRIATIRIGYADGFRRSFGNGSGKVLVNGQLAPVVGNIAMDMAMIDITGIRDVSEGDDVIIFGDGLSISMLAAWSGTIAYEIMTSISQRVQRVYYEE